MADSDDPFMPSDATVLRPRPGRRPARYAGADGARPARRRPVWLSSSRSRQRRARCLGVGLNPLVQAASPLLLLAGQLRGSRRRRWTSPACAATRSRRSGGSRSRRARAGIPNEIVLAARYALCAGLDEAVLSTPWGAQSEWAQHPLLVALHREAWGGEKFFEMLDRISPGSGSPHRPDGAAVPRARARLRRQVPGARPRATSSWPTCSRTSIARSASQRGAAPPELSLRWRGLEDRRNPLIRYVPWWVVGAAALAILAIAFTVYYARLASAAGAGARRAGEGRPRRLRAPRAGRAASGPDAQAAAGARGSARRR